MTTQLARPTAKEMSIAVACLVLILGGAFLAASVTLDDKIFGLSPPEGTTFTSSDVFDESQRLALHRTFFTAWASIILVTPALCAFFFRRTSESAARYWQAFWTVSFIAFLFHFFWAVFILFHGQWDEILKAHARVSAPIPDTIVTAWWGLDVLLAWLIRDEKTWIRIQRVLVHLAVFALLFLGSAIQGEHNGRNGKSIWSVALGIAMGVAVLISFLIWLAGWMKRPKKRIAPAV